MTKINVKICLGTTCFVMGGSKQQELIELVTRKYCGKVNVESSACLDLCRDNEFTGAPYVTVNEEVVPEATIEKVTDIIEKKINEQ